MRGVDDYGLVPLEGGWSGETYAAHAGQERTVVRLYVHRGALRGPEAIEVDAAVLRLVRGLLPVPEVVEVRRPDPDRGEPAVLVTSFLPGERLDVLWPGLSEQQRVEVGVDLGRLLARLACMPMPRPGRFVDGDLTVEPWGGPNDLPGFVAAHRAGSALAAWSEADFGDLLAVADQAQRRLDDVHRVTLVHSDVNPKNVLVDPQDPRGARVTGLVDWEFAHAGLPGTDLGNLLRFDREPPFVEAVLAAYVERVPDADGATLDQARASDLLALVDLAGRGEQNPVTVRASVRLRAIARTQDLHATH